MPIQGLRYNINSGSEQHRSYQSTGSFIAYNPNDGIALIALDRTATGLDYDHRLPSQSGGKFPGPINSYLSIYYQDQSGGGTPGLVTVYATTEQLEVPYFWSIGRALTTFSTSLDITQGTQPANPGSNISRLWVDSLGHLHILQSNGTDYAVIDSNNIGSQSLGGDLNGTIANGHVNGLSIDGSLNWTLVGGISASSARFNTTSYITAGHWVVAASYGYIWTGFAHSVGFTVDASSNMYIDTNNAGTYFRNTATGPSNSFVIDTAGNIYPAGQVIINKNHGLQWTGYGYNVTIGPDDASNMFLDNGAAWIWRNSNAGFSNVFAAQPNGTMQFYGPLIIDYNGQSGGTNTNYGIQFTSGNAGITSDWTGASGNQYGLNFFTAAVSRLWIFANGDIELGPATLPPSSTAGFPFMPRMGSPATGVPVHVGPSAFVFDDGNRRLNIYSPNLGRWTWVQMN